MTGHLGGFCRSPGASWWGLGLGLGNWGGRRGKTLSILLGLGLKVTHHGESMIIQFSPKSTILQSQKAAFSRPAYPLFCSQKPRYTKDKDKSWSVLRDISTCSAQCPGQVASMTGNSRKQLKAGEGTGTKRSCSFSPSAARLKHALLAAKRKVTGNLRTGNLIITNASGDTSNLLVFL